MADISYHFDEHMSGAVARALRGFEIDVETTRESGLMGASDAEHLEHARAHGRVVATEDDDYLRLHAEGRARCGIVFLGGGRRRSNGELVETLRLDYESFTAEQMVGRVEHM